MDLPQGVVPPGDSPIDAGTPIDSSVGPEAVCPPATAGRDVGALPTWTLLPGALLLYLVGQLGAIVVVLMVTMTVNAASPTGSSPGMRLFELPNLPWIYLGGAVFGGLLTIAFAGASAEGWRARLGWTRPRLPASELATVVIGTLSLRAVIVVGMSVLSRLGWLPGHLRPNSRLIAALRDGSPAMVALLVLATSVVIPAYEETLFRGFLQRGLLARWRPVVALAITAAAFSVLHGASAVGLAVLPIALWQGWLAWRTDSIAASVLSHVAWNGSIGVLLLIARGAGRPLTEDATRTTLSGYPLHLWGPIVGAIGSILFVACTRRVHHAARAMEARRAAASHEP